MIISREEHGQSAHETPGEKNQSRQGKAISDRKCWINSAQLELDAQPG
jgi:hypothetical protein